MKKFIAGLSLIALSATANAGFDFFDGNNGEWKMGPYGPYYEESNWPQWTPMYWMEEMMDSFDDNNNGSFGNMPFSNNSNGFNMPFSNGNGFRMPFNGNNGFQMPFSSNNAMPYGAYPAAPQMAPMMAPRAPMPPQMMQPQQAAPAPAAPVAATTAPGPSANKAEEAK